MVKNAETGYSQTLIKGQTGLIQGYIEYALYKNGENREAADGVFNMTLEVADVTYGIDSNTLNACKEEGGKTVYFQIDESFWMIIKVYFE